MNISKIQNAPVVSEAFFHQAQVLHYFQSWWKQKYLTALREFHKVKGTYAPEAVKIGDVVLIHNDSPRIRWKMEVVENLIKGKDGLPRAVEIRTSNGNHCQASSIRDIN